MKNLVVDLQNLLYTTNDEFYNAQYQKAEQALKTTLERSGAGKEFLGWLDLPEEMESLAGEIQQTVLRLENRVEHMVVVGIGGSYLGSRAVIEALKGYFCTDSRILFAGHQLDEDYLYELLEYLNDKEFGIIVISKSGTTTEPALAFRFLRNLLEEKTGREESTKRIITITDKKKGALRELADRKGYTSFTIPDNVGGRYSVLSPVGLVPIAFAGLDIDELLKGAAGMKTCTTGGKENPVLRYAAARHLLYRKDKKLEVLVQYHARLYYFTEWWKQLFGESEGKEKRGIFPVSAGNTTDLHSLGQYIQDGERIMFETVLHVEEQEHILRIPEDEGNLDKLNYLSGKRLGFVNHQAETGTTMAHTEGGVPTIIIRIPRISPGYLGQLIWFYELSCAVSSYMLEVNPFDQPGVEAYKRNMFKLLGKPGV